MPFQFKGKKILIISPEAWGNNHVSKHHYARELASMGAKVWFLNPPSQENKVEKLNENLNIIHYQAGFRGIGRLPRFIGSWITQWELNKVYKQMGCVPDIIWNFESSRFFELSGVKNILKIQHIVDLFMDFYRHRGAETADICFATTDFIREEQLKYNKKAFKIHHGYHSLKYTQQSANIPGENKIKAMYVGNLASKHIVWEKLLMCAEQHPEVDFIMIGPTEASNIAFDSTSSKNASFLQMKELKNVYFIGIIKPAEIPHFVEKADILLLCYQSDKYREQWASPHKMMEYFGSGKLIVASYTDEYKDKRELLCMAETLNEYPDLFTYALNNLEILNNTENQEKRKTFALANSYHNQIIKIENIINSELKF